MYLNTPKRYYSGLRVDGTVTPRCLLSRVPYVHHPTWGASVIGPLNPPYRLYTILSVGQTKTPQTSALPTALPTPLLGLLGLLDLFGLHLLNGKSAKPS